MHARDGCSIVLTLEYPNAGVGARATAEAMWDEYYSIWASTGTKDDCDCGIELFADADATVRPWRPRPLHVVLAECVVLD